MSHDLLRLHTLQTADNTMSASHQPVFEDDEDLDYDDMASSHSSEPYSPRFEPSLRSLVSRTGSPDHNSASEPDIISLSGDTASNAETVSDQLDGQDSLDEPYDHVRHDELEEEPDQRVIMSDHTIVPATPTLSQRLLAAPISCEKPKDRFIGSHSAISAAAATRQSMEFAMADRPYKLSGRTLHLLFVTERDMAEVDQLQVLAKVISAILDQKIDSDTIKEASDFTEEHVLQPMQPPYEIVLFRGTDQPVTVRVNHAVGYNAAKKVLILRNGKTHQLSSDLPDLVIFFHVPLAFEFVTETTRAFPQHETGRKLATDLAKYKVPMLEVSALVDLDPLPPVLMDLDKGKGAFPYLHMRPLDDQGRSKSRSVTPISLDAFCNELDDKDLSRHLVSLGSQYGKEASLAKMQAKQALSDGRSKTAYTSTKFMLALLTFLLSMMAMYQHKTAKLDASSDLTLRREALGLALNKSSAVGVNVSRVLQYPTTTEVVSGTTVIGLAFPTTVDVHVARADELFISLPKTYGSSAHVGLFRNGKGLPQVNITQLIPRVYSLSLKPSEAYGEIHVSVLGITTPRLNETVKVDLGNRLLHRATYENVAHDVQRGFHRDVEEVHSAAKAVQTQLLEKTHSVMNVSAHRAKVLSHGFTDTANHAVERIAGSYHGVTNVTHSMVQHVENCMVLAHHHNVQTAYAFTSLARNMTSAFSSLLTGSVPKKPDFARARRNSLRLKDKLFRKADVLTQQPSPSHSVVEQLHKVGRQVLISPMHLFKKAVTPAFQRVKSLKQKEEGQKKPGKEVGVFDRSSAPAVVPYQQEGLRCQKKCSKNLKGEIACHACTSKSGGVQEKRLCKKSKDGIEQAQSHGKKD